MRKLSLCVLAVMLLSGTAFAHNGALSLYVGYPTLTECSLSLPPSQIADISLYYIKDQGPDLGRAVEFMLLPSSASLIVVQSTWSPLINLTLGDLLSGISLTSNQCMGTGETSVFLGTIQVFNAGEAGTFNMRIVPDPAAEIPSPLITLCDADNTLQAVLGSWFVFNGSCSIATESRSWGGIKELFK